MAGEGYVTRMAIKAGRGQNMHAINRDALGFVDGYSVAVVDGVTILEVKRHRPAIVQAHRQDALPL